jgi:membrane fusion protein, epimerase transport system
MNNIVDADIVSTPEIVSPRTDDKVYHRLGWGVLISLVGVFGVWATFAPLESAIPASGKVIVASNNRVIQHMEGGIVKSILVQDGQGVKTGDVLIELDETQALAQLRVVEASYYHALALQARLSAERNHAASISFSPEFYSGTGVTYANETTNQQREFESRKKSLSDDIMILTQRHDQLQYQIEGLKSTVKSKEALLRTYEEETKELETLFKQQLIDKLRLRDAQRQLFITQSDISNAQSEISRALSQISEVNAQIASANETFMKKVLEDLSNTQTQLADSRARLMGLQDLVKRGKIVAPSDGVVTALSIHTIGGVISPSKPIMEIVPSGEGLIIEANVVASDITNIHDGLNADVQFAGFAHVKELKEVKGEIIHIGADAVEDDHHNLHYPVKIRITKEGEVELAKHKLTLQPGMPASVMIVVAKRTFADYLIHPFKQMVRASLNEQ